MDTADACPLALATAVHHHPRRDPRAPRPRLSTRAGDHQHQPTPQPEHPGPLTLPETGCQPQILHVGVPARALQPWDNIVYPSVTPANPSIPPHQPSRSVDPGSVEHRARPTPTPTRSARLRRHARSHRAGGSRPSRLIQPTTQAAYRRAQPPVRTTPAQTRTQLGGFTGQPPRKGDCSADSACNFLASTRVATVSSSAQLRCVPGAAMMRAAARKMACPVGRLRRL